MHNRSLPTSYDTLALYKAEKIKRQNLSVPEIFETILSSVDAALEHPLLSRNRAAINAEINVLIQDLKDNPNDTKKILTTDQERVVALADTILLGSLFGNSSDMRGNLQVLNETIQKEEISLSWLERVNVAKHPKKVDYISHLNDMGRMLLCLDALHSEQELPKVTHFAPHIQNTIAFQNYMYVATQRYVTTDPWIRELQQMLATAEPQPLTKIFDGMIAKKLASVVEYSPRFTAHAAMAKDRILELCGKYRIDTQHVLTEAKNLPSFGDLDHLMGSKTENQLLKRAEITLRKILPNMLISFPDDNRSPQR